jgi:hypothetical protein
MYGVEKQQTTISYPSINQCDTFERKKKNRGPVTKPQILDYIGSRTHPKKITTYENVQSTYRNPRTSGHVHLHCM